VVVTSEMRPVPALRRLVATARARAGPQTIPEAAIARAGGSE
jgi:hypothetical protein